MPERTRTPVDRRQFLERLRRAGIHGPNVPPFAACRDPKDDKFLALALAGRATFILTGDEDLLTLHPFSEIAILLPRQDLKSLSAELLVGYSAQVNDVRRGHGIAENLNTG